MGLSCLSSHWESSTAPNGLVEKERLVMIEFIVLKFKRQRFPEGEIIVRQPHCLDCNNHVINGCLRCLQPPSISFVILFALSALLSSVMRTLFRYGFQISCPKQQCEEGTPLHAVLFPPEKLASGFSKQSDVFLFTH